MGPKPSNLEDSVSSKVLGLNIDDDSDNISQESLETLKGISERKVELQEQRIRHYRDLGFRVARTAVLTLGILISGLAALISEDLLTISQVSNSIILMISGVGIIASFMFGTLVPLLGGYYSESNRTEARESILVDPEEETEISQSEVLVNYISHSQALERQNSSNISILQSTAVMSAQILLISVVVAAYALSTII